jgi:hypothetical protein
MNHRYFELKWTVLPINPAPRFGHKGRSWPANVTSLGARGTPEADATGMTTATPNIAPRGALAESDQKRLALGYLQDAWAEAVHDGIEGDCLAQTALFLAFAELIATYGEEPTARYADNLGQRIRNGEFSVQLSRQ